MSAVPKVSVIIPAFNAAPYLTAAIDSVLNQSHKSIEVVVVDDGSTDATAEIVGRYGRHVEYIQMRSNGGGPSRPRNVGIRAASGDYVALFDANGLMLPGKLSEQADFLNLYPEVPLVFTDFTNIGSGGDDSANFLAEHTDFQAMPKIPLRKNWYRLTSSLAYETLITDTFVGTSTVMFRRRLVDDVGYFDESVSHGEDLEFFFRVARRFDLGFVNGVYSRRRLMGALGGRAPALEGKLRVYSKQAAVPKSPKAAHDLDVCLAKILFSLGYLQRKRGERMKALGYYMRSWRRNPSNARIFVSALRAAFAK